MKKLRALATSTLCVASLLVLSACASQAPTIESRLTPGRILDDRLLKTAVQTAVSREFRQRGYRSQILPVVLDGRVFLIGSVESNAHKELVSEIVSDFRHARSVHNELQVSSLRSRSEGFSDRRIGAQARFAFLNDPQTRAEDIMLFTHKGTVHLIGIVPRSAGTTAAQLLKNIRGVRTVLVLLDYLD